jgi:hypothetical protein
MDRVFPKMMRTQEGRLANINILLGVDYTCVSHVLFGGAFFMSNAFFDVIFSDKGKIMTLKTHVLTLVSQKIKCILTFQLGSKMLIAKEIFMNTKLRRIFLLL